MGIYHIDEWLGDIRVATALLTRIPMSHPTGAVPDNLTRAQRVFPLVGAAIGAAIGVVFLALISVGIPPLAAAALALAASALLTGALHEDGLGDVGDGFGGGRDRAAKLAIMRDSRLGTYGALAVLVAFVVKAAALEALAGRAVVPTMVAAHTLGRAAIPMLALAMPLARSDGLGKAAGQPEPADVAIALALASAITFACLPLASALGAIMIAGLGGAAMAVIAWRQIGGVTGDVYGAAEQVIEVCVLLLMAARTT